MKRISIRICLIFGSYGCSQVLDEFAFDSLVAWKHAAVGEREEESDASVSVVSWVRSLDATNVGRTSESGND